MIKFRTIVSLQYIIIICQLKIPLYNFQAKAGRPLDYSVEYIWQEKEQGACRKKV